MAYKKIQFKRGTKTGMPILRSGEPGFTQDEKSLYIGDGTANQRFLNETQTNTRIDEKIAPVTQSITNNVAALNESIASNITTVNQAITDKAKINGEATNVNFIRNEIVKDGLVEASSILSNVTKNIDLSSEYTLILQLEKVKSDWFILNENIANGWGVFIETDGKVRLTPVSGGTIGYAKGKLKIGENATLVMQQSEAGNVLISINGISNIIISSKLIKMPSIGVRSAYAQYSIKYLSYNRPLTSKEIQHNFSVLNNTPSINKINDYAISTDTDHITDSGSILQSKINRVFYKNMCKEFTSSGEAISVNNGMDGYVLSATIQGQTVKNYYGNGFSEKATNWVYSPKNVDSDGFAVITNNGVIQATPQSFKVLPNTTYTMFCEIKENTLTGAQTLELDYGAGTYFNTFSYKITNGFVGIKKILVTTPSVLSDTKTSLSCGVYQGSGSVKFRLMLLEGDWTNKEIGYFTGLGSTQAIISNNGLKYSFYSNLEDKLANRVVTLGKVVDVKDTLEIMEDGNGVWTKQLNRKTFNANSITTPVKATNTIQFRIVDVTILAKDSTGVGICDKLIYKNGFSDDEHLFTSLNNAWIHLLKTNINYVESDTDEIILQKAKTYLSTITGGEFNIVYQLATPIVTTIDKSLVPAILTQATNTFTFGDAVAPYKATISVPVNRIAEMQKQLDEIKALIQTPSNINLTMNYIEDEYNKNQEVEGVM